MWALPRTPREWLTSNPSTPCNAFCRSSQELLEAQIQACPGSLVVPAGSGFGPRDHRAPLPAGDRTEVRAPEHSHLKDSNELAFIRHFLSVVGHTF